MTDAVLSVTEEQDVCLFLVETGVDYVPPTEIEADLDVTESKDTMVAYGSIDASAPTFAVPFILNLAPYDVGETTCYATYDIVYPDTPADQLFRSTSLLDGQWNAINDAELVDSHEFTVATTPNSQIRSTSDAYFSPPLGSTVSLTISMKSDDVGNRLAVGLQYSTASDTYVEEVVNLTTDYQVFTVTGEVTQGGQNSFIRIKRLDPEALTGYVLYALVNYSVELDVTAPTVTDVYTDASGLFVTLVFDEPVTGSSGITVSVGGSAVTTTLNSQTSTMITYQVPTIYSSDVVTVAASSSDIVDASDNALVDFSGTAVTNNSEETQLTLVESSTALDADWFVQNDATKDSATQFTLANKVSSTIRNPFTSTPGDTYRAEIRISSASSESVNLQFMDFTKVTPWAEETVNLVPGMATYTVEGVCDVGSTTTNFRVNNGESIEKVITFESLYVYKL